MCARAQNTTITPTAGKFPDIDRQFPVSDEIFPDSFAGNCSRSGCNTDASRIGFSLSHAKQAKFPVKFPVSREFMWRLVRSALRRQPASPADRETAPDSHRKARQWRVFLIRCLVSVLRFHESKGRIRGKSLVDTANIPVFRRRRQETGFDLHCVARAALNFR